MLLGNVAALPALAVLVRWRCPWHDYRDSGDHQGRRLERGTRWGVEMGFDGLIDGEFRPLTRQSGRNAVLSPVGDVEAMGSLGGTGLGSSRCTRFFTKEGRAEAIQQLEEYSISDLVVVGGNGTLAGDIEPWVVANPQICQNPGFAVGDQSMMASRRR